MIARLGSRHATFGLLCLLVTGVGWGLNWPAQKLLLREWPPLTARGLAGLAAALGLALLAYLRRESLAVPRAQRLRLAYGTFFNVVAWMGLSSVSLLWLNAGEGAVLCYTMPIWAALFAWPILGETPRPRLLAALGLALAGIAVLFGGGLALGAAKLPGIAAALAAAVLFALGTVLTKRQPVGLPPTVLVAWQVGLGAVILLLIGLVVEPIPRAWLSTQGWISILYMTAVPLTLCYLGWFAALRRLSASVASLGILLAPAIGVVSGALILGDPLGLRQLFGLGLTFVGILLALRSQASGRSGARLCAKTQPGNRTDPLGRA